MSLGLPPLLLPFLAMAALFAALFVTAMVAIVVWAYKRSGPYTVEEAARAEAQASSFLASVVPPLLPWSPQAVTDVVDRWQGIRPAWRTGKIDSEHGTIATFCQPEGPGLLAFAISRKGVNGFVRLCTSERELRLDFFGRRADVISRGQPLGMMQGSGSRKMMLLDPSGQAIGSYDRRSHSTRQRRYGEVVVHSRALGELKGIRIGGRSGYDSPGPILRNVARDLTPDGEDWLLAGIASEVLSDLVYSRLSD